MGANQKEVSEHDRFNTNRPDLCPALRWKGQFILADDDPTVPHSMKVCFGVCTLRPALVPMENLRSLAIAVRLDARATKPETANSFIDSTGGNGNSAHSLLAFCGSSEVKLCCVRLFFCGVPS